MSEYCSRCTETQRECRCLVCSVCDADIGETRYIKTMFKKRKHFCRRCNLSVCGKCLDDMMCGNCQEQQASYREMWQNTYTLETTDQIVKETAEKDIRHALDDMIAAIKDNSLVILQNLLEHCGNEYLDKIDTEGRTILYHAVKSGGMEIIEYLIERGSDINQVDLVGCSVLHHIASSHNTPRKGEVCEILISHGAHTFLQSNSNETPLAVSIREENFEIQNILEKIMYRDSQRVIMRYLDTKPDIPREISACLRYIVSKIKCLTPFDKKDKLKRNKSLNYRCLKDKEGAICEDPYKLKKTITDNNEKMTKLRDEVNSLHLELLKTTPTQRGEIDRLETDLIELEKAKECEIEHQREVYKNQLSILEAQLEKAKDLEMAATLALKDVTRLKRHQRLCWVPKSVTRKCADTTCTRVFRDGYSQHHCRCCGRVFCYDCSIQRTTIPCYGYDTPVRVCRYCYELLQEEVLCDFDETDVDEEQWRSVYYQSEANTDNLGKNPMSMIFKFNKTRSSTITSGYCSKTMTPTSDVISDVMSHVPARRMSLTSTSSFATALTSQTSVEYSRRGSLTSASDLYDTDSDSTLSNDSTTTNSTTGGIWMNNIMSTFSKPKQQLQKLFVRD